MSDNYSIVCKRCGRKLKSEVSRNRGYGPDCYRKIAGDEKRDTEVKIEEVENIEGQLSIEEVYHEVSGM